jgi:hypothetical protein
LPRTLKRLAKKDFVDVYPMVWKDFRKKGYVTAWAEDCPHIGTFTYRMVGFKVLISCTDLRPQFQLHYYHDGSLHCESRRQISRHHRTLYIPL